MKGLFRFLVAWACCVSVVADTTVVVGQPAAGGGGGGPALLVNETFDAAGYDLSWTESGTGTIDEDEATVAVSGQSLEITSGNTNDKSFTSFTAQGTAFACVAWRYASLGGTTDVMHFRDTANIRLIVRTNGSGALTLLHGATSATVTDAIPADTWVNVWFKYVQGTGGDGVAELGWSTTSTRPTSGTKFTSINTGTAATTVGRLYLGQNANETHTMYFDNAKVSAEDYPTP